MYKFVNHKFEYSEVARQINIKAGRCSCHENNRSLFFFALKSLRVSIASKNLIT